MRARLASWWTAVRRRLGLPWREPDTCPHPVERRAWSDGCGGEPAEDLECLDCGTVVFIGKPFWRRVEFTPAAQRGEVER